MAIQLARSTEQQVASTGEIYRTSHGESILVLGVRKGWVFVECPDGSFRHISEQEWRKLSPRPSRC